MEFLLTFFGFFMAILANMTGIEGGMIFVPLFILSGGRRREHGHDGLWQC